ncbi:MAG: DUF2797 domain-containing protein [Pseudomonadota bacterium]
MTTGTLEKMECTLNSPVEYQLPVGDARISMNERLGELLTLHYTGNIYCIYCNRKTKKSFNQGYCFPCSQRLARCDNCIVRPEKCHYDEGTCREPEWGLANCMQTHYVYLANSSGLKVGITRETNIPTRWIDQGAVQALPILKVSSRLQSGLVEVALKAHVSDKTDWRKMLKGISADVELDAERDALLASNKQALDDISMRFPGEISAVENAEVISINYPVLEYPVKVTSLNFDKTPEISGVLKGIKGQYLILDTGVLNIRKFGGYEVAVE